MHLALLQVLTDGMCFLDLHGAIRFWNDAAESISGFSVAEAVCARHAIDVFFLSNTDGQPAALGTDPLAEQGIASYFLRHKDGHAVPVIVRRLSVRGQNSLPIGTLVLFMALEGALQVEATEPDADARPPWMSATTPTQPLQWIHDGSRPRGILLIQIDDFEKIEKRFGPEASDKVINLVERTVANCLKAEETCRRLPGGLVLASIRSAVLLLELAERVQALVQSARLQWWGESMRVTVSIGGTSVGKHDSVADAIRRAEDNALSASEAGGNRVVLAET
jgi:diguanylate cyclase (GGDEF)-like protein/PAS domain S-box-containing protein